MFMIFFFVENMNDELISFLYIENWHCQQKSFQYKNVIYYIENFYYTGIQIKMSPVFAILLQLSCFCNCREWQATYNNNFSGNRGMINMGPISFSGNRGPVYFGPVNQGPVFFCWCACNFSVEANFSKKIVIHFVLKTVCH